MFLTQPISYSDNKTLGTSVIYSPMDHPLLILPVIVVLKRYLSFFVANKKSKIGIFLLKLKLKGRFF